MKHRSPVIATARARATRLFRRVGGSAALISLGLAFLRPASAGSSQSLGPVTLTDVKPRIVTPNGDSYNDKVFFIFDDTLAGRPVETAILDLNGAKVADLKPRDNDDTALVWDGRDNGGNAVPSGIYIYSIQLGHSKATGTLVVAR